MQNISDNDIDNLFRKASGNYNIKYNPESWNLLQKRMDKVSAMHLFLKRLGLLMVFIGIIVTPVIITNFSKESSSVKTYIFKSQRDNKMVKQGLKGKSFESSDEVKKESFVNKKRLDKEYFKMSTVKKKKELVKKDNEAILNNDGGNISMEGIRSLLEVNPITGKVQGATISLAESKLPNGWVFNVGKLPKGGVNPIEIYNSVLPQETKRRRYTSLNSIFMVSPDFSSALGWKQIRPGINYGVNLEYFPLRNFSISSGIVFSKKIYSATANEYKPYNGYWKKYPVPDKIDGTCNILDIPINLRYYYLNSYSSRAFLSLGLTSYLMKKESYNYVYTGQQDYKREILNENNHFFKVVNISVGMERKLFGNVSVGLEPFVKIPLAGVGYGNIKLMTAGAFFNVKTGLIRNKK